METFSHRYQTSESQKGKSNMKIGDKVEITLFSTEPTGIIIAEDVHNNPWADNWFKWHRVKTEKEIVEVQEHRLKLKK
jgi:hypothetical protein